MSLSPHYSMLFTWLLLMGTGLVASVNAAPWAAVKITSSPPGAEVIMNGHNVGITPAVFTRLPPGPYVITFCRKRHEDVTRSIVLQPGEKASLDVVLPPLYGLTLIDSIPSDADIQIDGTFRGRTPKVFDDLTVGRHRLRLSSAGFSTKDVDLLVQDRTPQKTLITLPLNSATLIIRSQPEGATIRINGIAMGTSPATFHRLERGIKNIEVLLPGFSPYRQSLPLSVGTTNAIDITLDPIPGLVRISSSPPGARVFINNVPKGDTPLMLNDLETGAYNIRLELKGHEKQSRVVSFEQGSSLALAFTLARSSGVAEIVTEPAGVRVHIDGDNLGITMSSDTVSVSKPLRIESLAQGPHQLLLTRKGYQKIETGFTIESNKVVSIRQMLRKQFAVDTRVTFRSEDGRTEVKEGTVSKRFPNGDIELETLPRIYSVIKASQIIAIDPIADNE